MIIDTHAHYNLSCFDQTRERLFSAMKEAGIEKVLCPAIDFESNEQMMNLLNSYDWIVFAIGIHPSRTPMYDWDDNFLDKELRRMAANERVAAIGELGLDYHHIRADQIDFVNREKEWFQRQLNIARDFVLPLVLHIRSSAEQPEQADRDAISILQEQAYSYEGVVHCYNSGYDIACQYLDVGNYYFGIGGSVTYPQADSLRDAVRKLPLERLVLETDAPFVKPVGCTGKRNTSLNLPVVIQTIAELKNLSPEQVEISTAQNAESLFFKK